MIMAVADQKDAFISTWATEVAGSLAVLHHVIGFQLTLTLILLSDVMLTVIIKIRAFLSVS